MGQIPDGLDWQTAGRYFPPSKDFAGRSSIQPAAPEDFINGGKSVVLDTAVHQARILGLQTSIQPTTPEVETPDKTEVQDTLSSTFKHQSPIEPTSNDGTVEPTTPDYTFVHDGTEDEIFVTDQSPSEPPTTDNTMDDFKFYYGRQYYQFCLLFDDDVTIPQIRYSAHHSSSIPEPSAACPVPFKEIVSLNQTRHQKMAATVSSYRMYSPVPFTLMNLIIHVSRPVAKVSLKAYGACTHQQKASLHGNDWVVLGELSEMMGHVEGLLRLLILDAKRLAKKIILVADLFHLCGWGPAVLDVFEEVRHLDLKTLEPLYKISLVADHIQTAKVWMVPAVLETVEEVRQQLRRAADPLYLSHWTLQIQAAKVRMIHYVHCFSDSCLLFLPSPAKLIFTSPSARSPVSIALNAREARHDIAGASSPDTIVFDDSGDLWRDSKVFRFIFKILHVDSKRASAVPPREVKLPRHAPGATVVLSDSKPANFDHARWEVKLPEIQNFCVMDITCNMTSTMRPMAKAWYQELYNICVMTNKIQAYTKTLFAA
ncbi:hypothetical protein CEK25_000713 [Fusarium fujikuroi]|nr:hypothetical protein CEK25_000713 [Fusarium fujikuroi]